MRLVFLILLLPALAAADDFAVSAATHGSTLDLTFKNTSTRAIHIPRHIRADDLQYDWLSVTLTANNASRTLSFIKAREKSVGIYADLAPGASFTESIDLVPWAIVDGEPLAPGAYQLDAIWDSTREQTSKQRSAAHATLAIAAPKEAPCTARSTTGLALVARTIGRTPVVEVGLHNASDRPLCLHDHVAAGEIQSDWMTIGFDGKVIHFDDDRTKAGVITLELPPGATSWHRWDLAAWAARKRNTVKLPKSATWLTVTYDSSTEKTGFAGSASTGVGLALP